MYEYVSVRNGFSCSGMVRLVLGYYFGEIFGLTDDFG